MLGGEGIEILQRAHVMIAGLGGVGSFAAEALARSGIGKLSLVEFDKVADTNRNRQIPALTSTVGKEKLAVMAQRLRDINPALALSLHPGRIDGGNTERLLHGEGGPPDFIADAVDDLQAKLSLITAAKGRGIPIISSMAAGYRLDPSQLAVDDVGKTHTCPLARRLRRALREVGIVDGLPVVWSKEAPIKTQGGADRPDEAGHASMVFVPGAAGLLMASYIVRRLTGVEC